MTYSGQRKTPAQGRGTIQSAASHARGGGGDADGRALLRAQAAFSDELQAEAVVPLDSGKRQVAEQVQKREQQSEADRVDEQEHDGAQGAGEVHPLAAARLHDELIEIVNGKIVEVLLREAVLRRVLRNLILPQVDAQRVLVPPSPAFPVAGAEARLRLVKIGDGELHARDKYGDMPYRDDDEIPDQNLYA